MAATALGENYGQTAIPRNADVFTSGEVAALLESSLDEVDYWVRSKLIVPSIREASGHGSRRLFSIQDVKHALLIHRLRQARWKPRQIAHALLSLKSVLEDPSALERPLLIHEGNAFLILCRHQGNELVLLDAAAPGQYVMVIALETLEEETRRRLARSK